METHQSFVDGEEDVSFSEIFATDSIGDRGLPGQWVAFNGAYYPSGCPLHFDNRGRLLLEIIQNVDGIYYIVDVYDYDSKKIVMKNVALGIAQHGGNMFPV